MKQTQDGGAAFPLYCGPGDDKNTSGLSLRDYFAAKAMQGWLASYGDDAGHPCAADEDGKPRKTGKLVAELSYAMADAMLSARTPSIGKE